MDDAAKTYAKVLQMNESHPRAAAMKALMAKVAKAPRQVAIKTTPPGVKIFLGGADRPHGEPTPTQLSLGPGRYELLLRKVGYEDHPVALTVTTQAHQELHRTMVTTTPKNTLWGWSAVGAGTVAAILGTSFLVSAYGEAENASTTDIEEWNRAKDGYEQDITLTWVSYGISAALVATGVILLQGADQPGGQSAQVGALGQGWTF